MADKIFDEALQAVADIPDGAMVLCGGFGGAGVPYTLLRALLEIGQRDLTCVSNHCGDFEEGLAALIKNGRVRKMIASFPRHPNSYHFKEWFEAGKIELELVPQGTLAERIRAAGAGIGAFYVRTGVGTPAQIGKETRTIDGQTYVLEQPIHGDVALLHAARADGAGNLQFHMAQRNFNPVMATAAHLTVAEADEIVPTGAMDPEQVVTPGIFVDRVVASQYAHFNPALKVVSAVQDREAAPQQGLSRSDLARRVARDIPDGAYVNLGIGMPTLVSGFLPEGRQVTFHSENGILGVGPFASAGDADADLVNASREAVTLERGAALFHHADSFTMVRGRHLQIAVMGGFQVSAAGDLANWILPGQRLGSIGGAMDLAVGAREVWIMMEHVTKDGQPKIVRECSYPLTGVHCVSRIYTDLAVIDVTADGLLLRELAGGLSVDDLQRMTDAPLAAARDLRRLVP